MWGLRYVSVFALYVRLEGCGPLPTCVAWRERVPSLWVCGCNGDLQCSVAKRACQSPTLSQPSTYNRAVGVVSAIRSVNTNNTTRSASVQKDRVLNSKDVVFVCLQDYVLPHLIKSGETRSTRLLTIEGRLVPS